MTIMQHIRLARLRHRVRGITVEEKVRIALEHQRRAEVATIVAENILPPDWELEEFCEQAAHATNAPAGFFSVVTGREQTIKAAHGALSPYLVGQPTPIEASVCALVVAHDVQLNVFDVQSDPLLERCLVLGGLRAYCGAPVHVDGQPVGALAVAAGEPRRWTRADQAAVAHVAALVSARVAQLAL